MAMDSLVSSVDPSFIAVWGDESSVRRYSMINLFGEEQCKSPKPTRAAVCTKGGISISLAVSAGYIKEGKCKQRDFDKRGSAEPIREAASPINIEIVVRSWPYKVLRLFRK
jgi:hypothetical protein